MWSIMVLNTPVIWLQEEEVSSCLLSTLATRNRHTYPCCSGEHQKLASLQLMRLLSSWTFGCESSQSFLSGNPLGL